MHFPFRTIEAFFLVACSLLFLGVAFFLGRGHRRVPGLLAIAVGLGSLALWMLAYAFQLESFSLDQKLFWFWMRIPFFAILPAAYYAFVSDYELRSRGFSSRLFLILGIEPVLFLLLAVTNKHHHWVLQGVTLGSLGTRRILDPEYGILFWLHLLYSAVLVFGAAVRMFRERPRLSSIRGRRCVAVALIGVVPVGGALGGMLRWFPAAPADLFALSLAVSGGIVAWSLYRFRLLDPIPAARDAVLESMDEAVFVLSRDNRIIDLNGAACRFLGQRAEECIGLPASDAFSPWPELRSCVIEEGGDRSEFSVGRGRQRRYYDLRLLPLIDPLAGSAGRIVWIRDVTDRKRDQEELESHRARLDDMVRRRTAELIRANEQLKEEILQRERVEAALRESETRYRQLVEYAPVGICEIDLVKGRFLEVNAAMCEETGYTREEFLGKELVDFVAPESRGMLRERIGRILEKESVPAREVYKVIPKNGEEKWAQVYTRVVREEGKPVRARLVVQDVTRRKQAEAALREREEKFRSLFEGMTEAVAICEFLSSEYGDPEDYRVLDANPAFEGHTGIPREQVVGKTARELTGKAFPSFLGRFRPLISGGGPVCFDTYVEFLDRHLRISAFSLGIPRFAVVFEDISEATRIKKALEESEERFRRLFDSITDLVYTHDMEGRFLSVNRAVANVLGYAPEELVGRRISDLMLPEFREGFFSEYLPRIRSEGRYDGISKYVGEDGRERYIEYRSVRVDPADGEPYVSGSGRDVTERILAERNLRKLREQLLHAQKMEAVGTLASGVAHDFNNILQAVSGYLQLLGERMREDRRARRYVEEIRGAVDRATDLVQRLLIFSRKTVRRRVPVDLNQVVARAVRILERTIPKMVRIEVRTTPDLKWVSGDPTQLEQVLMNLATNAKDAMPEGGVLTIALENVHIDAEERRGTGSLKPGDYVRLRVRDTGQGMDAATLAHIFEPFFTTKGVGEGTGLGLSTVYGIVRGHGGEITCTSRPGEGTDFCIYLPARKEAVEQSTSAEVHPSAVVKGDETLLLVDDEPGILEVGREFLQRIGYTVLTASSGEEALKTFRDTGERIDLVLLDLGMPGMGGFRCLEELRRENGSLKIVVSSGYSVDRKVKEALDRYADGFLPKPYGLAHLARKLREILDQQKDSAE